MNSEALVVPPFSWLGIVGTWLARNKWAAPEGIGQRLTLLRPRPSAMITTIGTVAVMVKDAKKSAKWYQEKLGFKITSDDAHWTTVGLEGSKTEFHLCPDEPLEIGNQGIVIGCDDLGKTYQELSKKGVNFTLKPTEQWGVMQAKFVDPDGNEFTLVGR
jgi:catechol 2,3-dioxygenase-like lactoylglutathione lyase family enzyme